MQILNAVAITLSLVALLVSTRLNSRRNSFARHANSLPALQLLLAEFRKPSFHENYNFVCNDLPARSADGGISGLSLDERQKLYDVGYLFQHLADLCRRDVVDEGEVMATLRYRVQRVWEALEPFVEAERRLNPAAGPDTFRLLEAFAARALKYPQNGYASAMEAWLRSPIP